MPLGCCLCRCRRNSSSQGLQESAPLGPAVPWLLCCRQFLLWTGTCSRVAEPPGAGCAGSCSFTCPGPRAEPCARSVFEDAMSSRHEAGGKCAGPWGAHQLRALGSSRGSGVLHPFPHGRVQSNPNPSGARGVSPAPPPQPLAVRSPGAALALPGGRFSARAVCLLLSCLLTGRGCCVSTAGELAFATWAPHVGVAAPLSRAGLQSLSHRRAALKAWAGVPCASGMKSHPASLFLEGVGGGAACVTLREAAGATAGRSLSAPIPANAAPQGSGGQSRPAPGLPGRHRAPAGTRSTHGAWRGRAAACEHSRWHCPRFLPPAGKTQHLWTAVSRRGPSGVPCRRG